MVFDDWERWKIFALLIIAVIAIFGVIWWVDSQNSPLETGTPQLSFNLDKNSGKAMSDFSTSFNIINEGDGTNDLKITIESQAFETITFSPLFGISADTTKPETITISVNDVENGYYPVTVTYSCNGVSETLTTPEQFCVIPNMKLIEVNYLNVFGQAEIGDANNINREGETKLSFKVHSNSENAIYDNLYAVLIVEDISNTITTTPSKMDVDPMAPNGQNENPYSFTIKTKLTPEGTYDLTVVLYSDGHVVDSKLRTLDVV